MRFLDRIFKKENLSLKTYFCSLLFYFYYLVPLSLFSTGFTFMGRRTDFKTYHMGFACYFTGQKG